MTASQIADPVQALAFMFAGNARVAWWEKLLKCKAVRGRTDQPLAAFCKGAG